LKKQKEHK